VLGRVVVLGDLFESFAQRCAGLLDSGRVVGPACGVYDRVGNAVVAVVSVPTMPDKGLLVLMNTKKHHHLDQRLDRAEHNSTGGHCGTRYRFRVHAFSRQSCVYGASGPETSAFNAADCVIVANRYGRAHAFRESLLAEAKYPKIRVGNRPGRNGGATKRQIL